MTTIEQHLGELKGKKITLIFQQATKTNRIDDGSIMYLEQHSYEGTLSEVFEGGWILVDCSLFNLKFVMEIYGTT